jgi:hypothetical protein
MTVAIEHGDEPLAVARALADRIAESISGQRAR